MRNYQLICGTQPAPGLPGDTLCIGPAGLNDFFSFSPGISAGFFHHPAGLINSVLFSLDDKGPGIGSGLVNHRKGLFFSCLYAFLSLGLGLLNTCKGFNHG
jgi:hypothetical protein